MQVTKVDRRIQTSSRAELTDRIKAEVRYKYPDIHHVSPTEKKTRIRMNNERLRNGHSVVGSGGGDCGLSLEKHAG